MARKYHGIFASSSVDALAIAAGGGRLREMTRLIADGANINGIAAHSGATALHCAVRNGIIRSVRFLIDAGADVNVVDRMDLTPLMCACSRGKVKGSQMAICLIESAADATYVRQSDKMTALKFAVHDCSPKVLQKLIDHGADVDGPPGTRQTALMIAARSNNVGALKVLVKNGADILRPCLLKWADHRTAEGLAELERRREALSYLRRVRNAAS